MALSLHDYLEAAASHSPTPGGGCVSALAGANAAAMICMVAELTMRRKGYEAVREEAAEILAAARGIMTELTSLADRDMEAFERLVRAWRLPAETAEQKLAKERENQEALLNACAVPLAVAGQCLALLRLAVRIAPIGNKTAISDAGVGVYLAEAAMRAVLLNVDINLPSIQDPAVRQELAEAEARHLAEAASLSAAALAEVGKRLA